MVCSNPNIRHYCSIGIILVRIHHPPRTPPPAYPLLGDTPHATPTPPDAMPARRHVPSTSNRWFVWRTQADAALAGDRECLAPAPAPHYAATLPRTPSFSASQAVGGVNIMPVNDVAVPVAFHLPASFIVAYGYVPAEGRHDAVRAHRCGYVPSSRLAWYEIVLCIVGVTREHRLAASAYDRAARPANPLPGLDCHLPTGHIAPRPQSIAPRTVDADIQLIYRACACRRSFIQTRYAAVLSTSGGSPGTASTYLPPPDV